MAGLREDNTKLTQMLCHVMQWAQHSPLQNQAGQYIYKGAAGQQLHEWWIAHQESDKQRKESEAYQADLKRRYFEAVTKQKIAAPGLCGTCYRCRREQCKLLDSNNNPHNTALMGGGRCAHCSLGCDHTITLPIACGAWLDEG